MSGVLDVVTDESPQERAEVHRSAIWEFIADFAAEHGYSPTIRQIAHWRGISISTVHHHLQVLAQRGEVLRTPRGYIISR
jgi:SOS-response transcriptional repressor LexA